jgi:hypothetical protein
MDTLMANSEALAMLKQWARYPIVGSGFNATDYWRALSLVNQLESAQLMSDYSQSLIPHFSSANALKSQFEKTFTFLQAKMLNLYARKNIANYLNVREASQLCVRRDASGTPIYRAVVSRKG